MFIHIDIGHAYKVQHGQSSLKEIIMHEDVLKECGTKVIANHNLTGICYPVGTNMTAAMDIAKEMADEIHRLYTGDIISLWCRGSSGAIMAALVSSYLSHTHRVTIEHVKKEGENSHSYGEEKYKEEHRNIIIDDFISSGSTIRHIIVGMMAASGRRDSIKCLDSVHVDAILVAGKYHTEHRIVPVENDISSNMVHATWQINHCSLSVNYIICEGYL